MYIIDDFLDDFEALREYAKGAQFKDVVSPYDGVVYPLICDEIPEEFANSIFDRLGKLLGREPESTVLFMRLSPYGTPAPQQVHSDIIMGKYSLILYMNDPDDCVGGTSFLSHNETGMGYAPQCQESIDVLVQDQNNAEAWTIRDMVQMKPNRGLIFDAARIHRAEPVGGFGSTNQDGRLVLTCFFS